jgi:competence protein ComEA
MNLNTASASQLQRLPRIGPKMAERILTYRTEKGGFKRVSELQNVRGIGEKTLEKLAPYLFVEGEA